MTNWRSIGITAAITITTLLTGCTQMAAATPSPAPTAAVSTPSAATDQHSSTALTCASASILESTLHNAHVDLAHDAISKAQWMAVVNSTVIGFRSLAEHPQWGLQAKARSLIRYIDASSPTQSGAMFDPDDPEWESLRQDFNASCEANGTEVTIWAATGG